MAPTWKVTKVLKTFRSPKVIETTLDFLRTRFPVLSLPFALLRKLFTETVRFEGNIH